MKELLTKYKYYFLFLVVAVFIFVICICAMSSNGNDGPPLNTQGAVTTAGATTDSDESTSTGPETTVVETIHPTTEPPATEPPVTEPPATEPPVTEPPVTVPPVTEPPVTEPPVTDVPGPSGDPVYPMPQSPAVDDSYFSDTLFVGDSRTQGIQLYGDIKNATYYASQGLNVVTAMNNTFITENGQSYTIVDAIKRHPEFKKIYICLGVNEYWMAEELYRYHYGVLLDAIRQASPDAKIFVYSIFPLFDGLAQSPSGLNNEKMTKFNKIALDLAVERGMYFVDVAEAFEKADGRRVLDTTESSDGIHLNVTGTLKLCYYIRTHT